MNNTFLDNTDVVRFSLYDRFEILDARSDLTDLVFVEICRRFHLLDAQVNACDLYNHRTRCCYLFNVEAGADVNYDMGRARQGSAYVEGVGKRDKDGFVLCLPLK